MGYVAAVLRNSGVDVKLIDLALPKYLEGDTFVSLLDDYSPHLVGMTAYLANLDLLLSVASLIKKRAGSQVVIGGPEAMFMAPQALLEMKNIDFICHGAGEMVLPALISSLGDNKADKTDIPGLSFRRGEDIAHTGFAKYSDDLDELPSPFLTGVFHDLPEYRVAVIEGSRGCAHGCHFCITPRQFGTLAYHCVERVMEEIKYCVERGIRYFQFTDSNFTGDRERTIRLCRAMSELDVSIRFWCETRADLVDEELLEAMCAAGLDTIAYGLESADDSHLRLMNKKLKLDEVTKAVEMTSALDIKILLFFIYGLPFQSKADVLHSISHIQELGLPVRGQRLCLYNGANYSQNPVKYGFNPANMMKNGRSIGYHYTTEHLSEDDFSFLDNILNLIKNHPEARVVKDV